MTIKSPPNLLLAVKLLAVQGLEIMTVYAQQVPVVSHTSSALLSNGVH